MHTITAQSPQQLESVVQLPPVLPYCWHAALVTSSISPYPYHSQHLMLGSLVYMTNTSTIEARLLWCCRLKLASKLAVSHINYSSNTDTTLSRYPSLQPVSAVAAVQL